MKYFEDVKETEKATRLIETENSKSKGKVESMGLEQAEFQKKMNTLESHQRTVDHVLGLLDLKEEDAKVISEMIMDYRERKRLKVRLKYWRLTKKVEMRYWKSLGKKKRLVYF